MGVGEKCTDFDLRYSAMDLCGSEFLDVWCRSCDLYVEHIMTGASWEIGWRPHNCAELRVAALRPLFPRGWELVK